MQAIGELLLLLFFNLRCRDKIIEVSQKFVLWRRDDPLLAGRSLFPDMVECSLWPKTAIPSG
jgi:hypothetical protein